MTKDTIRCTHKDIVYGDRRNFPVLRCHKKAIIAFRFKTKAPVFLCAKHTCENIDNIYEDYMIEDHGGRLS